MSSFNVDYYSYSDLSILKSSLHHFESSLAISKDMGFGLVLQHFLHIFEAIRYIKGRLFFVISKYIDKFWWSNYIFSFLVLSFEGKFFYAINASSTLPHANQKISAEESIFILSLLKGSAKLIGAKFCTSIYMS